MACGSVGFSSAWEWALDIWGAEMKRNHNIVDLEVIYIHQTDRAVLVKIDEKSKEEVWLPLSQIEIDGGIKERGRVITTFGPEQLLVDKGLI